MKRVCKQCGKEFEITQHEIQFYKKKKLSLPKRCKECREKNKDAKQKKQTIGGERVSASVKSAEFENRKGRQETVSGKQTSQISKMAAPGSIRKRSKKSMTGLITALFLIICSALAGLHQSSSTDNPQKGAPAGSVTENLEFRSEKLLEEHFEKHGIEMGFETAEEYEDAAALVVVDEEVLHKTEKEDGDDVYYLEDTNEFVVISTDGYIRTYFEPEDGMEYFERQ